MGEVAAPLSIPCMHGGSEEHGYANNSRLQSFTFNTHAKPHLSQALIQLLEHFIPYPLNVHQHETTSTLCPNNGPIQGLCDGHLLHVPQRSHEGLLHEHPLACPHTCSDRALPQHQRDDGHQLSCGRPSSLPMHVDNPAFPCSTSPILVPCRHAHYARLVIADFGCSHGPNTLDHAKFIVQVVLQYLTSSMDTMPIHTHQAPKPTIEIQYFFSDLPSNNFNSLLQSLDSFWVEHDHDGPTSFNVEVFHGAVAGSFHKRLFPTASLHLGISIYGLQWLSQVPQEVVDKASPSWNGGHIWLHGQRMDVVDAYTRQFKKDFASFLHQRSQELVNGGILFLFFPGRVEKNPKGPFFTPNHDIWNGCYEDTWKEMVVEGVLSQEEMDMFNIPIFYCHLSEMQEALKEFSSELKVLKVEVLKECKNFQEHEEKNLQEDPEAFGEFWSRFVATLMEPMVQAYLGSSRARMLFEKLKHQATLKAHLSTSMAYDMILAIIQRI